MHWYQTEHVKLNIQENQSDVLWPETIREITFWDTFARQCFYGSKA